MADQDNSQKLLLYQICIPITNANYDLLNEKVVTYILYHAVGSLPGHQHVPVPNMTITCCNTLGG